MRVYISWSGEKSRRAAMALGEWLPWVIRSLEPYVPPQTAGAPWDGDRERTILNSGFGILCVTRENLHSPWLSFEAGALLMAVEHPRVTALLVDVDSRELDGPAGLFRTAVQEEESIRDLLIALNSACGDGGVSRERLDAAFAYRYPDLRDSLGDLDRTDRGTGNQTGKTQEKPADHAAMEELMELSRENQRLLRRSDARLDSGLGELRRSMEDLKYRLESLLSGMGDASGRQAAHPGGAKLTQAQIDRLIRVYRGQIHAD